MILEREKEGVKKGHWWKLSPGVDYMTGTLISGCIVWRGVLVREIKVLILN